MEKEGGSKAKEEPILKREDPLYGILTEEQVGVDPTTGRPKIDKDVLEGMRIFILAGPESEKVLSEGKIRNSLEMVNKDPMGHYYLSLEPIPIRTRDLYRGKGIIFNYEESTEQDMESRGEPVSLKDKTGSLALRGPEIGSESSLVRMERRKEPFKEKSEFSNLNSSTGYRIGSFEASPSGTTKKRRKIRKRPHMCMRKPRGKDSSGHAIVEEKKRGKTVGQIDKRKTDMVRDIVGGNVQERKKAKKGKEVGQTALYSNQEIVPNEGLSNV